MNLILKNLKSLMIEKMQRYRNLIIVLLLFFIVICLCSCVYNEPMIQDEYITIYDKNWNTMYYGKIRKD